MSIDIAHNNRTVTYSVPACGSFGIPRKPNTYSVDNQWDIGSGKYISVNGLGYYTNNYYVRSGDIYTKLNVPKTYSDNSSYFNLLNENEQAYCAKSNGFSKSANNFTLSYHHDIGITCVIICPEKLRFNPVHGDNTCIHNCSKPNHCIQVLANNPGYITKFNLYYRSANTNGKWIGLGVFNGRGVGVGKGVGVGVGKGVEVIVGVGFVITTPLFQTSFLPDLMQVNL